jgi:hypothetical protein
MKFFVPIIYTKNNDERKNKFRIYKEIQFLVEKYIWGRGIKTEEQMKEKKKMYNAPQKNLSLRFWYPGAVETRGQFTCCKEAESTGIIKVMVQPAPPKRASCIFQKT